MRITSTVIRGKGLGKNVLGYPTANAIFKHQHSLYSRISLEGYEGSWYVTVQVIGNYPSVSHKAVCGISKKGSDFVLEVHILDFNEDIYDKGINIDFISRIREQIIFKNLDESRSQLESDIEYVKNYKSCDNCKFCVYQDHGYSNYTVEGTVISCLMDKFNEYDDGYDNYMLGLATFCDYYNEGEKWVLDVDGENYKPTADWILRESRDAKIKNIL